MRVRRPLVRSAGKVNIERFVTSVGAFCDLRDELKVGSSNQTCLGSLPLGLQINAKRVRDEAANSWREVASDDFVIIDKYAPKDNTT